MDKFVAQMRKENTACNIKTSFAIHLAVDGGVVKVRAKPRMAACVQWSPAATLYDANDVNHTPLQPPDAVPEPRSPKVWTRLPKIVKTLQVTYTTPLLTPQPPPHRPHHHLHHITTTLYY